MRVAWLVWTGEWQSAILGPVSTLVAAREVSDEAVTVEEARGQCASGTMAIVTYNVHDGQREGLYFVGHSRRKVNVDIFQQTETTSLDCVTKNQKGYVIGE